TNHPHHRPRSRPKHCPLYWTPTNHYPSSARTVSRRSGHKTPDTLHGHRPRTPRTANPTPPDTPTRTPPRTKQTTTYTGRTAITQSRTASRTARTNPGHPVSAADRTRTRTPDTAYRPKSCPHTTTTCPPTD